MKDKPNCYDCKHRGTIPGDCHSCCLHPKSGHTGDLMMGLAMLLGNITMGKAFKNPLNVRGNETGIRNGWFMWPVNFDPTWLESCDGFEKKEK